MIENPQYVILAAGKGSRLGEGKPKALTPLANGETILSRQIRLIRDVSPTSSITIVVGYRSDEIRDAVRGKPGLRFVENKEYLQTNTSKSLLAGFLSFKEPVSIIWLNGDVVFSESLLPALLKDVDSSSVVVNNETTGAEEIKYTVKHDAIHQLSKTVDIHVAVGEAVGINVVLAGDVMFFTQALTAVEASDYFEKAIELTIDHNTVTWLPFLIDAKEGVHAKEVDFPEDLEAVNAYTELLK